MCFVLIVYDIEVTQAYARASVVRAPHQDPRPLEVPLRAGYAQSPY